MKKIHIFLFSLMFVFYGFTPDVRAQEEDWETVSVVKRASEREAETKAATEDSSVTQEDSETPSATQEDSESPTATQKAPEPAPAAKPAFMTRRTAGKKQEKPSSETWLKKKGEELLKALSVLDTKERYVKLRRIAFDVFDQNEMPRLAMGKHWKELISGEQEEFRRLFFDYFVVTYGSFNFDFSDVTFEITETVPSGKDILVKTKVKLNGNRNTGRNLPFKQEGDQMSSAENGDPRPVANDGFFEILFALREKGSDYYIRDAKFEGQSVIVFLRSLLEKDFASVSFNAGKLLQKMRTKINTKYRAAEDLAKAQAQNQ